MDGWAHQNWEIGRLLHPAGWTRFRMIPTEYATQGQLPKLSEAITHIALELMGDSHRSEYRKQWLGEISWAPRKGIAPTGFSRSGRNFFDDVVTDLLQREQA